MKILFVRAPVALWPYHPAIYPLSFLYLSAALMEHGIKGIKIIDCQIERIGWNKLRQILFDEKPDIVGVSINSITTLHEAGRLALMAKEANPTALVLAGGVHASATPRETMNSGAFDIIIRYEGEETICELVDELSKPDPKLENIRGIAFKKDGKVMLTPPRPLINNLDDLPDLAKAYALLKLEKYKGDIQYGDATIQAGRGCVQKCTFCACWPHYGEHSSAEEPLSKTTPRLRLRSVSSVLNEMETLYRRHNKRHFFFIDDCFNTDQGWQRDLAEGIIKRKLKLKFTSFMRLDFIIRDYKEGVLDKLVEAGLSMAISGIERTTNEELKSFNKNLTVSEIKEGYGILHRYPRLIKLAIAIVGTKEDTVDSIRGLGDFIIRELRPDFCSFQALTPLPGTLLWEEIKGTYPVEQFDFSRFHWSNAVMPTAHLSKEQIRSEITRLQIIQALQWRRIVKALADPYSEQRKFYRYIYGGAFAAARQLIMHRRNILSGHYCDVVKPDWYDD